MSHKVLTSGSQLQYADPLGAATLVAPVNRALVGSGSLLTLQGQPVLLEGDTPKPPMIGNYQTSSHSLMGALLLKAKPERADQLSTKLTVDNKKVVLDVEADSIAQVVAPAINPNPVPPVPDSTPSYEASKHAKPLNPAQKFTTV